MKDPQNIFKAFRALDPDVSIKMDTDGEYWFLSTKLEISKDCILRSVVCFDTDIEAMLIRTFANVEREVLQIRGERYKWDHFMWKRLS